MRPGRRPRQPAGRESLYRLAGKKGLRLSGLAVERRPVIVSASNDDERKEARMSTHGVLEKPLIGAARGSGMSADCAWDRRTVSMH